MTESVFNCIWDEKHRWYILQKKNFSINKNVNAVKGLPHNIHMPTHAHTYIKKKKKKEQEYQHWKFRKSTQENQNKTTRLSPNRISHVNLNLFEIFPFKNPVVFYFVKNILHLMEQHFPKRNFHFKTLYQFSYSFKRRNMGFLHWYNFIFPEPGFAFPCNKPVNSSCLLHIPLVFYKKTSKSFTALFLSGPPQQTTSALFLELAFLAGFYFPMQP